MSVALRRRALVLLLGTCLLPHARAHDPAHPDPEEVALGSLADAELAFTALAEERGRHAALLANLADDGVVLEGERNVVERDLLASANAPPTRFRASPAGIGVSRAFDQGYVTGPCTIEQDGRRQHGVFLDVWARRGTRARWRMVVSSVTSTPEAVDFVPFGATPRPAFARGGSLPAARAALQAIESLAPGAHERRAMLATAARQYRGGHMPVVDGDLDNVPWRPQGIRLARSADMAAVHGMLGSGAAASVAYLHLWLRDAAGAWRLAFDVVPAGVPPARE